MYCPRLDHFVRFNYNGTVSRCGHMVAAPQFNSLEEMENSQWLKDVKQQFYIDQWPTECNRCRQTEFINKTSIRLNSIAADQTETQRNYLQVGGVLDNECNSACQMCSEQLSTKIGKLISKNYIKINNVDKFWNLPQDRILHLDINGGEPSISKNYKNLLNNLPINLKSIRVNTNGAVVLPILREINARGIDVTVTVSFDGTELVHDYIRWPTNWDKFQRNLSVYQSYNLHNLNLWTTVSALNVNNLKNILQYAKELNIDHSYGLLVGPKALNVAYSNHLTTRARKMLESAADLQLNQMSKLVAVDINNQFEIDAYINKQDRLRGISIHNFIK